MSSALFTEEKSKPRRGNTTGQGHTAVRSQTQIRTPERVPVTTMPGDSQLPVLWVSFQKYLMCVQAYVFVFEERGAFFETRV